MEKEKIDLSFKNLYCEGNNKMSKYEQTLTKAKSENLIDERKVMVFSTAKTLPNGEYGLCLLCVNGNTLGIYDTDFNQNIGEMLYKITLSRISNIKNSSFIFNRYLKFEYEGCKYHLADFGDAKRFNEVILEESKKK